MDTKNQVEDAEKSRARDQLATEFLSTVTNSTNNIITAWEGLREACFNVPIFKSPGAVSTFNVSCD